MQGVLVVRFDQCMWSQTQFALGRLLFDSQHGTDCQKNARLIGRWHPESKDPQNMKSQDMRTSHYSYMHAAKIVCVRPVCSSRRAAAKAAIAAGNASELI